LPEGRAVSQSAGQLRAGQLGTADLTASTLANIGLGENFYFAFGVIAVTAGVAAPLTILAAGLAIVLLAFTVVEFTKAEPSAGSFITYVETSLGARAGVVTALLVVVGYTVAIAGIFTMSGGMVTLTLAHYTSWRLPWEPLALILTSGAIGLTMRGVKLSTKAVASLSRCRWQSWSCSASLSSSSSVPISRRHRSPGRTSPTA
jgi:amino acid transporter